MKTPIVDFVRRYSERNAMRLHMPGHKGMSLLGMEGLDITEIEGADVLYSSDGIIKESCENATELFGTQKTLYSCQGTSLSIRAMLFLALICNGRSRKILAARNAHRVFMSAAAMLDLDVEWLCGKGNGIISCEITAEMLNERLSSMNEPPVAFYITSPDYLGNMADIDALSAVCHKYGVLMLCDNAHGAYLRFLSPSMHPISLGADMCCDSAHKTLPVLTGGGYLHISKNAPKTLADNAERAMTAFSSTSPSYLILQSLDMANKYLTDGYAEKLDRCAKAVNSAKESLAEKGYGIVGQEPLKITVATKGYGYTGFDVSKLLDSVNIVCEFADEDFIVFMLTPEIYENGIARLLDALLDLPRRDAIITEPPRLELPRSVMSPREAAFSPAHTVPASQSKGRILACENVSCPPAVPVAVCGEEINESAVALFEYYGIKEVTVVDEKIT